MIKNFILIAALSSLASQALAQSSSLPSPASPSQSVPSLPAVQSSLQSIDELKKMSTEDAQIFFQQNYLLKDIKGDFALRRQTLDVFKFLAQVATGQNIMTIAPGEGEKIEASDRRLVRERHLQKIAELSALPQTYETQSQIAELRNQTVSFDGKLNPFKREGFKKMFAQVLIEEEAQGLEITYGAPHVWSQEILEAFPNDFVTGFPKILVAMASGFSSMYLKTDHESDLEKWMLAQPLNSIQYPELFRQSLRLTKGDVYLAVLTMENILSVNWRRPNREDYAIIRRLKPMHNQWNNGGTKFGFWYHFTGTLLYGYTDGKFSSRMAGIIESLGSQLLSGFEAQTQKYYANKWGAYIGDDLAEIVQTKSYRDSALAKSKSKDDLLESSYLNLTEDFRDRLNFVRSPELKISAMYNGHDELESIWVKTQSSDLKSCKLDIAIIDSLDRYAQNWIKKENVDLSVSKWFMLPVSSTGFKSGEIRVFVSGCGNHVGAL